MLILIKKSDETVSARQEAVERFLNGEKVTQIALVFKKSRKMGASLDK